MEKDIEKMRELEAKARELRFLRDQGQATSAQCDACERKLDQHISHMVQVYQTLGMTA